MKTTPAEREGMRSLRKSGMSYVEIAKLFNISWQAVQYFCIVQPAKRAFAEELSHQDDDCKRMLAAFSKRQQRHGL